MKTIIFVNFRFGANYASELLGDLRLRMLGCRIVAVVDEFFVDNIPHDFKGQLDAYYYLKCGVVDHCTQPFNYSQLKALVSAEQSLYPDNELRIVCADEMNLLNAGKLRREFGIVGMIDNDIFPFRDKIEMKRRLDLRGIRVPKYQRIDKSLIIPSQSHYNLLVGEFGGAFIVKPIDCFGSYRVYPIHSFEDYLGFCSELPENPYELEVEEFIVGDAYHVDTIRQNGQTVFSAVYQYSCPNFDVTVGKNLSSIQLTWDDELCQRLKDFSDCALDVLGARDQMAHMELFVRHGEIVFIEVGARPPGGPIVSIAKLDFGFSYMDWQFTLDTGIDVRRPLVDTTPAFWIFFPKKQGVVRALNAPAIDSEIDLKWLVSVGDDIRDFSGIAPACIGVVQNADREKLIADFHALKSFEAFTLES